MTNDFFLIAFFKSFEGEETPSILLFVPWADCASKSFMQKKINL